MSNHQENRAWVRSSRRVGGGNVHILDMARCSASRDGGAKLDGATEWGEREVACGLMGLAAGGFLVGSPLAVGSWLGDQGISR